MGAKTCTEGTDSRDTRFVADRMRLLSCGRGLEELSGADLYGLCSLYRRVLLDDVLAPFF